MIEHVVLFRFSQNTTQQQRNKVISQLRALKGKIPGIVDLQCNHNFNQQSNRGFEIGLTVRLESRDALLAYGPHEEHRKVTAYMAEVGLEERVVVDFAL